MILKYLKLLEANKKSKKILSNIDHSLAKTICSVNVWRTLEHFGSQSPVRPVCTRWRSSIIIDDNHLRKSPVFQCYNGSTTVSDDCLLFLLVFFLGLLLFGLERLLPGQRALDTHRPNLVLGHVAHQFALLRLDLRSFRFGRLSILDVAVLVEL